MALSGTLLGEGIEEFFGLAATHNEALSLAIIRRAAGPADPFRVALFSEYVVCKQGRLNVNLPDGSFLTAGPGEGLLIPKGCDVQWNWPEEVHYIALCLPAFSMDLLSTDKSFVVAGACPRVIRPVDVVNAPGITITEYFGGVASQQKEVSFAIAKVKAASEEAWQAPGFDEVRIMSDHRSCNG